MKPFPQNENPKIAIVTGASSGIGKSAVTALINSGYRVHAAARRVEIRLRLVGHVELGRSGDGVPAAVERAVVGAVRVVLQLLVAPAIAADLVRRGIALAQS